MPSFSDISILPKSASTVLLIDPSKEDREYWAHRLTMASPDYVVLEADSGEAGLAMCRWQRIDCVLVEFSLRDMSGFQVLVTLVPRARHPDIAVIFLTRLALCPMRDLALKNGAQAYLEKRQTTGDVLNIVIRDALARVPRRECSFGEFH